MYRDLREFIDLVDGLGALRRINSADLMLEIGGITEIAAGMPECPAILFDNIKGYPAGFRIFTNATVSAQRAALALGLDPHLRPLDALKAWMAKRQTLKSFDPVEVKDAAYLENSMSWRRCRSWPPSFAALAPRRRRSVYRLRQPSDHGRCR